MKSEENRDMLGPGPKGWVAWSYFCIKSLMFSWAILYLLFAANFAPIRAVYEQY